MNWKAVPLRKVLSDIQTGTTPSTSRPEFFGGSIPWFTPSDIGGTRDLLKSSRCLSEHGLKMGKAKLFPKGSLLVTCIGNIGRVGILEIPGSSNQQITSLRFNEEVSVRYAYYWFIAHQHRLERHANQAVVPILNNERLGEIEFNYPSTMSEQERIAGQLAQTDRLRRIRCYALELTDTFLAAAFVRVFGLGNRFKQSSITDLVESGAILKIEDGNHGESYPRSSEFGRLGIPFLTAANVLRDEVRMQEAPRLPEKRAKLLRIGWIHPDDVLLSHNATVGRVGVVPHFTGEAVVGTSLTLYRLNNERFVSRFFAGMLRSDFFQAQLEASMKQTTRNQVPVTRQLGLRLFEPSLETQRQFARLVERQERSRVVQRESLRQAEHLFQTLLERAFTSQL